MFTCSYPIERKEDWAKIRRMQINYRPTVGGELVTVHARSLNGRCRDRASLLDIEHVSGDPRRPVQSASIYRTQGEPTNATSKTRARPKCCELGSTTNRRPCALTPTPERRTRQTTRALTHFFHGAKRRNPA